LTLLHFTVFQKDLDDFLPFLRKFFFCIASHNDVINVLQMFQSFTLLQRSLDQSMANGGAVFPPLGQLIPGILGTPPSDSELWPALCCQRDGEECISDINSGVLFGCL